MFSATAGFYVLPFLTPSGLGAPIQDISGQLAAANGSRTVLKTQIAHGIAAQPTYRGTFDIVWSCLLTILACIYNAIHLNVPPRKTGKWMLLLRKMKWAATALLAPEIVLYTAVKQFLDAYQVKKEVNEMRGQTRGKNKPELIDLRYGFYVRMGGFIYDVEDMYDIPQMTLTPRGVIALAREGHCLDIDSGALSDKSKANIFTKSLICVQVTWMVIQCSARKAAGYPLTLLEIHTMVHVVCALSLYVLWWKKPFDVVEPTVVNPINYAHYSGIVALMLMGSYGPEPPESFSTSWNPQMSPNTAAPHTNTDGSNMDHQEVSLGDRTEDTIKVLGQPLGDIIDYYTNNFRVIGAKTDPGHENTVCTLYSGQYLSSGLGPRHFPGAFVDLAPTDHRRWDLGGSAIAEILKRKSPEDAQDLMGVKGGDIHYGLVTLQLDRAFTKSSPNLAEDAIDDLLERASFRGRVRHQMRDFLLLLLQFFAPLTAIYGGIHLTAWNFEFPSRIESIIWRTACFIIMGGSFALLALPFLARVHRHLEHRLCFQFCGLYLIYKWLLFLCYLAVRLYLVVESFLSLRHVPIGVYAAVPWVQNIPHV